MLNKSSASKNHQIKVINKNTSPTAFNLESAEVEKNEKIVEKVSKF